MAKLTAATRSHRARSGRVAVAISLLLHAGGLTAAAWTTTRGATPHPPRADGIAIRIGWSAHAPAPAVEPPPSPAPTTVPSFAPTAVTASDDPIPFASSRLDLGAMPTFARQPGEPPTARSLAALARMVPRVVPPDPTSTPTAAPPSIATATATDATAARSSVPGVVPGRNPAPDYPAAAVRRRLEGTVVVHIVVAADGHVVTCHIARSSGWNLLDDAALAAARRWHFHGGPGEVEQPFTFQLRG